MSYKFVYLLISFFFFIILSLFTLSRPVQAQYCGTPPAPTGLTPTGAVPSGVYNFTWDSVGGTTYKIRVNDESNGWNGLCDGAQNPGDICQDWNSNSFSFNVKPGNWNSWWVHGVASCNGSIGPATGTGVYGNIIAPNIYLPAKSCTGNQATILVSLLKAANDGAVKYDIYRQSSLSGAPVLWHEITPADFVNNVYFAADTATDVTYPNSFTYYAVAVDKYGNAVYSYHSESDTDDFGANYFGTPWSGARVALDCGQPARPNIYLPVGTCTGTNPNLVLRIDAAAHATAYQVYRWKVGDPGFVGTWSFNSGDFTGSYYYVDSNVTTGSKYLYFVWAYNQNQTNWIANPSDSYHILSDVDDDGVNYHNWAGNERYSGVKYAPDCQDPTPTFFFNLNDRFVAPFDTIVSDNTALLKWTVQHVNQCTATSNPVDLSWNNTPQSKLTAQTQQQNTQILTNPTTAYASYTLSCVNTYRNITVQSTVGVNVQQVNRPFIQTTGGDIHTNKDINIPGN